MENEAHGNKEEQTAVGTTTIAFHKLSYSGWQRMGFINLELFVPTAVKSAGCHYVPLPMQVAVVEVYMA